MSKDKGSSLKPHVTGNFMHDWWFRIQLNPNYLGLDIKFLLVRSGMMGWLLINLSVSAKCIRDENLDRSMILFQIFSSLYIVDYFVYEEYMTSTVHYYHLSNVINIEGWWLLRNKVELTVPALVASCMVFLMGWDSTALQLS